MRFGKSTPPPHLNKADQTRMLRMVLVLGMVVFAMKLASDPAMWNWFFRFDPPKPAETKKQVTEKDVDFGVKFDEESPLKPDEFRSRPDAPIKPAVAEAGATRMDVNATEGNDPKDPTQIDPALLAEVSDDSLGIRVFEREAYYAVLNQARKTPIETLHEAAITELDYAVLMTDSPQYRGLPITVEGTIRQIDRVSLEGDKDQKEFGIDEFFVAWMFTETSGNNPYRLVFSELSEDFQPGKKLEINAKFTGFFFKRESYESVGGFHKAPTLIGRSVETAAVSNPGLTRNTGDLGLAPYVVGLAVVIAVGLGVMIWRFNKSDQEFGHQHVDHFTSASPAAIGDLNNLETTDPKDLFRQMEADAETDVSEESESSDTF